MKTLIYNAEIVNEGRRFHGGLLIDGDRIAEIYEGDVSTLNFATDLPLAAQKPCTLNCIDAGDALLIPGIIDTHVHFREPGLTHKADIAHESRAALAGGVTSTMDMPNVNPPTTTLERWQERMALGAQESRVNYAYYLGATNGSGEKMEERGMRIPLKLFMGSSTGHMLVDDRDTLRRLFRMFACHANSSVAPFPIVAHCEDTPRINERMAEAKARWGEDPDVEHHPWIRDAEACFRSSSLAVKLARETGARLHIAHISTERELSLLSQEAAPGSGLPHITGEVCVPHLLFCDEDYKRLGTRIKCNPAVKTRRDRDAIRRAVADGRILTIATDHAPHTAEDKANGANGISGIETAFALCYTKLVRGGFLTLPKLVQLMSTTPSQMMRLPKGRFQEGLWADFALVDITHPYVIRATEFASRGKNTPFEGLEVYGRVLQTVKGGEVVYQA